MRTTPWFLSLSLSLSACGDDAPSGSSPIITNLVLQPQTIPIGTPTVVSGSVDFTDPDGDVRVAALELTTPSGQTTPTSEVQVQGTTGVEQGQVGFALQVMAPTAGSYTLTVWVEDAEGHASDPLSGTLTAP